MTPGRRPFDLAAYVARSRTGPCFVCAHLAAADPADVHHEVFADGVLLDTHVLLWWLADDPFLGTVARDVIAHGDTVYSSRRSAPRRSRSSRRQ